MKIKNRNLNSQNNSCIKWQFEILSFCYNSQKNVRIVYHSLCVCVQVCMCVFVEVIFAYHCVWTYKWYLICVCMKIHARHGKFEVVTWMYQTQCVAKFAEDWPRKKFIFCFLYIHMCVCVCVVMILTKEQNIIIALRRK